MFFWIVTIRHGVLAWSGYVAVWSENKEQKKKIHSNSSQLLLKNIMQRSKSYFYKFDLFDTLNK